MLIRSRPPPDLRNQVVLGMPFSLIPDLHPSVNPRRLFINRDASPPWVLPLPQRQIISRRTDGLCCSSASLSVLLCSRIFHPSFLRCLSSLAFPQKMMIDTLLSWLVPYQGTSSSHVFGLRTALLLKSPKLFLFRTVPAFSFRKESLPRGTKASFFPPSSRPLCLLFLANALPL